MFCRSMSSCIASAKLGSTFRERIKTTLCTAHSTGVSRMHVHCKGQAGTGFGAQLRSVILARNTHGYHMLHVSCPADACE